MLGEGALAGHLFIWGNATLLYVGLDASIQMLVQTKLSAVGKGIGKHLRRLSTIWLYRN